MTDSDEFNMTYNEENLNESVNQRQFHHSKKNNKRNSYCLNNNTVFMDSSSPVFTSDYNTRKFNNNNEFSLVVFLKSLNSISSNSNNVKTLIFIIKIILKLFRISKQAIILEIKK